MKRLVLYMLVFTLMFSLFGCRGDRPSGENTTNYSTADVMVSQAAAMAQQVVICAQESYMEAMQMPAQVIAEAEIFRQSVQAQPAACRIITTKNVDFGSTVVKITNAVCGTEKLACIGALSFSTMLQLPEKQDVTTVVYLRYGDMCHYVVVFVPGVDKTVSATVYPLFFAAAEQILKDYFSDTVLLSGAALQQAIACGAQASVKASVTGNQIDADYYIQLVRQAFSGIAPVSKSQAEAYSEDAQVIATVCDLSRVLGQKPAHTAVYYFPAVLERNLAQILEKTEQADMVRELTRQRLYLSHVNTHCNRFGIQHVAANAVLKKLCRPAALGAVAKRDEQPVLVVMSLGDRYTLLVAVYPDANQIYETSFAYLPASFEDVSDILIAGGAEQLH